MPETHERRQCSVCGEFWSGDTHTCPRCDMETYPYTIEVDHD